MRILAIETSCDETSAAVVVPQGGKKNKTNSVVVLSNVTATSLAIHATTGGIIPENAAREQVKYIIPVIIKALLDSDNIEIKSPEEDSQIANRIFKEKIDGIAVTYGPGLIGSLLIGVETTKTLSFLFNKPIMGVNHLLAHLFANLIQTDSLITFPFVGLIVSGGHTDLLVFKSLTNFKWLGGTRDDAAGEALDKIGRLLGLSYPAGPEIEARANKVKNNKIKFQSPMIGSDDFDFSFSGLKAEVSRFIQVQKELNPNGHLTERLIDEICEATQTAIFSVLVKKTIRAANLFKARSIVLGGGVSANQTLRNKLELEIRNQELGIKLFAPEKQYATDNAAMIGAYALMNPSFTSHTKITANPELYFD